MFEAVQFGHGNGGIVPGLVQPALDVVEAGVFRGGWGELFHGLEKACEAVAVINSGISLGKKVTFAVFVGFVTGI